MSDSTGHHARREGALQTAVFIAALAVLIAVLYASFVVQSGRLEALQRQETAAAAATARAAAAPPKATPGRDRPTPRSPTRPRATSPARRPIPSRTRRTAATPPTSRPTPPPRGPHREAPLPHRPHRQHCLRQEHRRGRAAAAGRGRPRRRPRRPPGHAPGHAGPRRRGRRLWGGRPRRREGRSTGGRWGRSSLPTPPPWPGWRPSCTRR